MPPSPNAVPPSASSEPSSPGTRQADSIARQEQRTARWLQRADLLLRVMVRLYLGMILLFLPWTRLWLFNRFFLFYAPIAHLMESGAIRGMVSGLGLLNLWIAISDAIHYKEV